MVYFGPICKTYIVSIGPPNSKPLVSFCGESLVALQGPDIQVSPPKKNPETKNMFLKTFKALKLEVTWMESP